MQNVMKNTHKPRCFNGIILKLNKLKGYKYVNQSFQYIE